MSIPRLADVAFAGCEGKVCQSKGGSTLNCHQIQPAFLCCFEKLTTTFDRHLHDLREKKLKSWRSTPKSIHWPERVIPYSSRNHFNQNTL